MGAFHDRRRRDVWFGKPNDAQVLKQRNLGKDRKRPDRAVHASLRIRESVPSTRSLVDEAVTLTLRPPSAHRQALLFQFPRASRRPLVGDPSWILTHRFLGRDRKNRVTDQGDMRSMSQGEATPGRTSAQRTSKKNSLGSEAKSTFKKIMRLSNRAISSVLSVSP
jgi:hypothetical protein